MIFDKMKLKKVRGPKMWIEERRPDREDAEQIADDMVAHAIISFRDDVLRPGRWSPDRGASLKTFFVMACLYEFPNAYRRWLSEQSPSDEVSLDQLAEFDPDLTKLLAPAALVNPADIAQLRDTTVRSLEAFVRDNRTRAMLYLQARRYHQHEIAEFLGVTEKAVERALARQRAYRATKLERR
jgi:DNA-directed RNA polymerase specialized sigma24 family protein